jgi:predicted ABC-class ATPase
MARVIPFGYTLDPDREGWLNPVVLELDLLEQAKAHLKQYSYRQVADWLTTQTGRKISHVGLMKRIQVERQRKTTLGIKQRLSRKYEEILNQIEALETTRIGSRANT